MEKKVDKEIFASINAVNFFNPYDYAKTIQIPLTGERSQYLPLNMKRAWFSLKYPNGKVLERIDALTATGCRTYAAVYADKNDPEDAFLGCGASYRPATHDGFGTNYVEAALSAAVSRAFNNAGFTLPFDISEMEAAEYYGIPASSDESDEEPESDTPPSPTPEDEEPSPTEVKKRKSRTRKSAEEPLSVAPAPEVSSALTPIEVQADEIIPEDDESSQLDPSTMTFEQALTVKMYVRGLNGKTVKEAYKAERGLVLWYGKQKDRANLTPKDAIAAAACHIVSKALEADPRLHDIIMS